MRNQESQEKRAERLNLFRPNPRGKANETVRFVNHRHLEGPKPPAHVSDIATINRLARRSWQLMQELSETNRQLSEAFCKYVSCQCALRDNQDRSSRFPRPDGKNKKTLFQKSPMPQLSWTPFGHGLGGDCDNQGYQDVLSQL